MFSKNLKPLILLVAVTATAAAAATGDRGFNIRPAILYLSPDTSSTKMEEIERGRELSIVPGGAPSGWLHVLPTLKGGREVSGWVLDKGVVFANTPNGDRIIFGEAVDSEAEASRRHGRKGADKDAMRLYYAVYDLFPQSPMAGEALYRAADIQWQLDFSDPMLRRPAAMIGLGTTAELDDSLMKMVTKKLRGTKWAEMAEYRLIDVKLCRDWEGLAKCPEKESEFYEKYASEHPQSPTAPEALYKAAWRQAALVEIYRGDNQAGKSASARQRAIGIAQRLISTYPQTDWAARAQRLAFLVEQGVNTYGTGVE